MDQGYQSDEIVRDRPSTNGKLLKFDFLTLSYFGVKEGSMFHHKPKGAGIIERPRFEQYSEQQVFDQDIARPSNNIQTQDIPPPSITQTQGKTRPSKKKTKLPKLPKLF